VVGFCERGNEILGSVKGGFLSSLSFVYHPCIRRYIILVTERTSLNKFLCL
jgi:hypothetical protein